MMFNFSRSQLVAAYVLLGMALIGILVPSARTACSNRTSPISITDGTAAASTVTKRTNNPVKPAPKIVVHVAGRVQKPGVYELKPGSRANDAVNIAGGALPDADLDSINLAQKLQDGMQVYIGSKGSEPIARGSGVNCRTDEVRPQEPSSKHDSRQPISNGPDKLITPGQGKVNLNTASASELQRLPGVGPSMAQRIINYRRQHGRFSSISQLDNVNGIGPGKLAKMRPFVSL